MAVLRRQLQIVVIIIIINLLINSLIDLTHVALWQAGSRLTSKQRKEIKMHTELETAE